MAKAEAEAVKRCWQCQSSDGGPERAYVRCRFRIGGWGSYPIVLPTWAWDAISQADREVHSTCAQDCEGFSRRVSEEAGIAKENDQ